MRNLLALTFLGFAGCATQAGFQQRMSAYIGHPEAALVERLGVPARTYETDGHQFIQYERQRVVAEPTAARAWGWASQDIEKRDCSVTFEIEDAMVKNYTSRGNDCVALAPD